MKTNLERTLFVFEVIFDYSSPFDPETGRSSTNGRSVIVEVDLEGIFKASGATDSEEAARHSAEEIALQAAIQTVEKDFPHGFKPPFSVTQMGYLPEELRRRSPTLHHNEVCAWMV